MKTYLDEKEIGKWRNEENVDRKQRLWKTSTSKLILRMLTTIDLKMKIRILTMKNVICGEKDVIVYEWKEKFMYV